MMENQMEKQRSKILLLISLFKDNLTNDPGSFRRMDSSFSIDSNTSSAADSTTCTENGLIRIALLRDTLVMVGHHSLQLVQ
jgi:hypothetical protein